MKKLRAMTRKESPPSQPQMAKLLGGPSLTSVDKYAKKIQNT